MPSARSIQLNDGDLDLFRRLWELRLAHIGHLQALTGRSRRALNRRLVPLAENGFLCRAQSGRNQPFTYALDKESAPFLVAHGVASAEEAKERTRRPRLRERSARHDLFLRHELLIADIHVGLRVASCEGDVRLHEWRQGSELNDHVIVRGERNRRERLPVRPDALFILEDRRRPKGRNRLWYFLEADRSTTTHATFKRKVRGYRHYLDGGHFERKHDAERFGVLTLTLTDARAANLCEAAGDVLSAGFRRMFFFGTAEPFQSRRAAVFEDIFVTPRDHFDGTRYRLAPPLVKRRFDS